MSHLSTNRFEAIFGVWSDHVTLANLASELKMQREYLHTSGDVIKTLSSGNQILAKRHYAGLSKAVVQWQDSEIDHWAKEILTQVSLSQSFTSMLHNNEAEAALWVSVIGKSQRDNPNFSDLIVKEANNLKISILVENYTKLDAAPERTWVLTNSSTPESVL